MWDLAFHSAMGNGSERYLFISLESLSLFFPDSQSTICNINMLIFSLLNENKTEVFLLSNLSI